VLVCGGYHFPPGRPHRSLGLRGRFVALTSETPRRYLARLRADRAAQLLRDTDDSIHQVALAVGSATEQALSKAFTRSYGIAPGRYRREQRA
jgi:transcriptional regulator GlxA family with amidase domain